MVTLAELVDVTVAVTLPTPSDLPAPLAMTLATLRLPCRALRILVSLGFVSMAPGAAAWFIEGLFKDLLLLVG